MRRATSADAAGIAHIRGQSWRAAYSHIFSSAQLDTISEDEDTERWKQILERRGHRAQTLVAVHESRAEGFSSFGPENFQDDSDVAELYAIYVLPEAWSRGIGQALMRETLAELLVEAFAEAVLWVYEDNPRARRFYERAGWYLDGGAKHVEWLGTSPRAVRYRIALDPASPIAGAE